MASIANLLVSLKADFGSTDANLESLIGHFEAAGSAAENAEGKVHSAGHGAEEAGEEFGDAGELVADFGKELLAAGAEALELTGLFEALKEAVEVSAEIESSRVALEAFTGSAEAATEVIESMEAIAKSEALAFPELLPAAQRMMAMGFSAEQTEKAMKAAGNAAWAMDEPVGNVTQKISQMALSGMFNARMLKTLGLSLEDVAKVMGVSANEVAKAGKALDVSDRIDVLTQALGKFGDVGSKEADTVKGKWVELKNTWHEAFGAMGEDLSGVTKLLESLVTNLGGFIDKGLEAAGVIADIAKAGMDILGYNSRKGAVPTPANVKQIPWLDTRQSKPVEGLPEGAGETGPVGSDAMHEKVEKALAPERAKENAAANLAMIAGEQEAAKQSASIARERANSIIEANHMIIQSIIDNGKDEVTKARNTAQEEIRVAKEKQQTLGDIDAAESKRSSELIKQKRPYEVAQTYSATEDPDAQAAKIRDIDQKNKNELEKNAADLASKQQTLADGTSKAVAKSYETMGKAVKTSITKLNEDLFKAWDELSNQVKKTAEQVNKNTEESGKTIGETVDTKTKGDADVKAVNFANQKIALEGEYAQQLAHTNEQQIAYLTRIAVLENAERQAKIAGLKTELGGIPKNAHDDQSEKKRAELDAEIAKLKADSANADLTSANAIVDVMQKQNNMLQAEKTLADTIVGSWSKINFGTVAQDFANTLIQIPEKIGSSLAGSLFNAPKQGESKGQEVLKGLQQTFKQVGQQLASQLIGQGIESLIAAIAEQFGLQLTTTASQTGLIVSAITLGSASIVTAIGGSAIGSAAGSVASGAGGAASSLATAGTAAATGGLSMIAPLIGGVISGVISAVATFIGDARIVKAINQTTAAIYSLHGETGTGLGSGSSSSSTQSQAPTQGFFQGMLSSMFTALTGAGALDVNIVSISPLAIGAGFIHMFGFAGGGRPEPGVPYIVGEHGPEVRVDDAPGMIIPHGNIGGMFPGGIKNSQGNPSDLRSGGTTLNFHGANFYGVSNTREMMRQMATFSKDQGFGMKYNNG